MKCLGFRRLEVVKFVTERGMKRITIVGGHGFIGSAVTAKLRNQGVAVYLPEKGAKELFSEDLGIVIYCAGNGDCQKTPFKVYAANTDLLARILEFSRFDRLIYLSSTRVYIDQKVSREDSSLQMSSKDPRRLFNLTKMLSEELCERSGRDVLVLRPSNIYGPAINSPLFLPMIVKNAIQKKRIDMYVERDYGKDYLSVGDLADVIVQFAGRDFSAFDIFNVASGKNVSAEFLANIIQSRTGCEVEWHSGYKGESFPVIAIDKLKSVLNFEPESIEAGLGSMIDELSILLASPNIGKK